ncbi:hypothetical protein GAZ68_07665 [Phocaeicola vulgatus]|nr:hypothetical protein GAZ68_07665 [Phocaeicola vulgatus]
MKRMKLAACFVLALGLAACQGGNPFSESKRTHTPVYVYRNPIKPVMDDQLPQFANYPDGRTKLGLLGPVQSVTCMGFPIIDISFNEQGNITYTCSSLDEARRFSERNTFVYDESGRLQDIRDEAGSTHPAFVYDADGRLISEGQGRYKSDYTYHANGKLRKARGHEFDEEGRLVRRSGYTQNIYVCDAKNDYNTLRSESTFSYTDGLCTLQEETLYYHYYDVEKTLSGRHEYAYNSRGDLIQWNYSGAVYARKDSEDPFTTGSYTLRFDYEYDDQGNWTTMRVYLPANFSSVRWLQQSHAIYNKLNPVAQNAASPIFEIRRSIDYYLSIDK